MHKLQLTPEQIRDYELKYCHLSVAIPHHEAVESDASGHLRFEQGRGVLKTEEADCVYCVQQGLNDGRWHDPAKLRAVA